MSKVTRLCLISVFLFTSFFYLSTTQAAYGQQAQDPLTELLAQEQSIVLRVTYGNRKNLNQLTTAYDVWEEAISHQSYVTILASDDEMNELISSGYQVEIDHEMTRRVHQTSVHIGLRATPPHDHAVSAAAVQTIPSYACYRTVEETYSSLANVAAVHPTLATWTDVGDSWDKQSAGGPAGYDIYALKLTNSAIAGPKPPLMIIAAIHAREYTTAEMATRFAEYLVDNYGVDPDVTWLLDYHEIHILPQTNPDGRKIAEGGIYWRKNRNPTNGCSGGTNWGVDLNRNSSFQWGGSGSTGNTCNQTYRGPSAASEPEVQAIQNYASSIFTDQRGPGLTDPAPADTEGIFITIHSYSELVLFPWGWSDTVGPNEAQLATLGRKFGFHNGYEVCSDCLYLAAGVTDDWAYGEFGVASYTYELGTEFFQQCTVFEDDIYPDNLPALLYAAKAARRPYQAPAGPEALNLALDTTSISAGTPVTIDALIDDTRSNSNGHGIEPIQAIQAARYSIDQPSWQAGALFSMNPTDGTFNSSVEGVAATIDTAGLTPGKHTIFVEGQDAAGNWGVPTAIYITVNVEEEIYVSLSSPANVGFNIYDEDIAIYDNGIWSIYFDGSDVGLGGAPDLNAFHILDDGNLLLSFDQPVTLGGTLYDDSDILLFTVNTLGTLTNGTFSLFFDGSANGFDTIGEDIDTITMNAAGELVISTLGSAQIPRPPYGDLTQQDDDLARRRASDGIWLRGFDGSDVGLTINTEDVWGAQVNATTGVVYLTTFDAFDATGLSGDGNDVFTCSPGTLGNTTSCALDLFWDGDEHGLTGERIDALAIGSTIPSLRTAGTRMTTELDPSDYATFAGEDEGYDDIEDHLKDVDDTLDDSASLIQQIFLPLMQE